MPEPLLTRYMQPLLAGRRAECFNLISDALHDGHDPEELAFGVVWPAMAQVERLFRDDRIDTVIDNMACRISRTVTDQLQLHLPRKGTNGKRIVISCADDEREQIGGQMLADLLQSDGWEVYFIGASVPGDELLKLVGHLCPQVLMIYGRRPSAVPGVRRIVELIREIGVCPTMNIVASGGVFNRVDGLWQEVGADVFVEHPRDVVRTVNNLEPRKPGPRRLGIVKKRRRRRKATVLA
jgi:methanogenic corrinoid protein MtbC1